MGTGRGKLSWQDWGKMRVHGELGGSERQAKSVEGLRGSGGQVGSAGVLEGLGRLPGSERGLVRSERV